MEHILPKAPVVALKILPMRAQIIGQLPVEIPKSTYVKSSRIRQATLPVRIVDIGLVIRSRG